MRRNDADGVKAWTDVHHSAVFSAPSRAGSAGFPLAGITAGGWRPRAAGVAAGRWRGGPVLSAVARVGGAHLRTIRRGTVSAVAAGLVLGAGPRHDLRLGRGSHTVGGAGIARARDLCGLPAAVRRDLFFPWWRNRSAGGACLVSARHRIKGLLGPLVLGEAGRAGHRSLGDWWPDARRGNVFPGARRAPRRRAVLRTGLADLPAADG